MYCTGGIRCEKGGPIAEAVGFKEVYQLEGGILNYFKECGGAHYQGDCYVFDDRVALRPDLQVSDIAQCSVCQSILSAEDQDSVHYVKNISCPACLNSPSRIIPAHPMQERKSTSA
jgi:predicted sulfurtransferase